MKKNVSIIIPAYNEENSISLVLDRINSLPMAKDWDVIVVDDGSSDKTGEVAKSKGARVFRHPYNIGNGASICTGINNATGNIVIMMDGDGQHPPELISQLLACMNEYDMVVGARTTDSNVSRFRSFGNFVLNRVACYLSGREIKDLTSGFRAVKLECLKKFMHLFPQRYSYPTTITLAMMLSGYFVKYVAMDEICKRQQGRSNLRPFQDGLRFIVIIFRMIILFNPIKIFLPFFVFFFLTGLSMGVYDVVT
ncbi:MAG: glycosyltransferase family 2 protein, partial [Oligoflexia bacterium]|nr:glycosyltransferase family 2 protein [Oligoflexia bacterium]